MLLQRLQAAPTHPPATPAPSRISGYMVCPPAKQPCYPNRCPCTPGRTASLSLSLYLLPPPLVTHTPAAPSLPAP
ncbi:hypothetical protein BU26DRAFT_516763 [Trematosphaeria pertusa]|uniref:Uncharacterized protein n=1 Tax=Trematosphaeria pertusa TaxID=390896 RepID=A0A6A6INL9_9PLEO|nr:uncharacterized protein BU26DRAFT_516763 [Trematosphaeria pertusa]KAF2252061.1 hypothetical protein BU26DRAFT_516763 [Trematosphaeria pertusa]